MNKSISIKNNQRIVFNALFSGWLLEVDKILKEPHVITLTSHFSVEKGKLTVLEKDNLPFQVKRVYWVTDNTNPEDIKGNQANRKSEMLLACLSGTIQVFLEKGDEKKEFILHSPEEVLYVPPMWWREIEIEKGVVLLVIASEEYNTEDLIRDKDAFKKID